MDQLKRVISIITYIVSMGIGIFFFVGFFLLGTFVGFWGQKGIEWIVNWINSISDVAIEGDLINPELIPDWTMWVIAIPSYIFSLLGLGILILTMRTNSSHKEILYLKHSLKIVSNSNYYEMTQKELKELLTRNNISFKKRAKKLDLVILAEKKLHKSKLKINDNLNQKQTDKPLTFEHK